MCDEKKIIDLVPCASEAIEIENNSDSRKRTFEHCSGDTNSASKIAKTDLRNKSESDDQHEHTAIKNNENSANLNDSPSMNISHDEKKNSDSVEDAADSAKSTMMIDSDGKNISKKFT